MLNRPYNFLRKTGWKSGLISSLTHACLIITALALIYTSFPRTHLSFLFGVIADTHGLFDSAILRHFKGVDHILPPGTLVIGSGLPGLSGESHTARQTEQTK